MGGMGTRGWGGFAGKSKGIGGGMGTRGWGGFAGKSKGIGGGGGRRRAAWAQKGLCHLLVLLLQILLLLLSYSLVTAGGF